MKFVAVCVSLFALRMEDAGVLVPDAMRLSFLGGIGILSGGML